MTPPAAIPGSRYRALLVGVDDYPVKPLAGCVNDIDEIQRILVDQVGVPIAHVRRLASPRPGAPHRTDVPAQPATQANLREAFAGLARDAQPGERVLVYYSGHGLASAYSHPGDGRLYHRESLVPADVYGGGQPRLVADYEVNAWLGALARRGVAVTVVLDCCHAAGVTRDAGLPALRARTLRLDVDLGWTGPITGDALPPRPATRGDRVDTIRTVDDCQVVAACLNDQTASEGLDDHGRPHGLLTEALIGALATVPAAELTQVVWGRIWPAVCARVATHNPWQQPWMAGPLGTAVLAGPRVDGDGWLPIAARDGTLIVEAGELASVTQGTRVAVYGPAPARLPALGSAEELALRCGVARVITPAPGSAVAAPEGAPFDVPEGARARIIEAGAPARLRCAVEPADPALIAAISASAFATVTPRAEAEVRLERVGGQWLLTDAHHDATPDRALIAFDGNGEVARALVDHYFHYALPLRMAHQVRDLHGALELCVLACPGPLAPVDAVSAELVRAAPILAPGAQVCFRVRNESAEALRVTLVSVAASGRVQHLGDQQIPKHSEYRFWARNELGKPFSMALPPGRREGVDRLVAIGTTALDRDLRYLARATRFVDLVGVRRGPSRGDRDFDDGVADRDSPPVAQWTSALEVVTTRAPGYTP